jgi:hypothetical protein
MVEWPGTARAGNSADRVHSDRIRGGVAARRWNQVTQQNAAGSEESASAAEEMSARAEELRGMVTRFRLSAASGMKRVVAVASGTDPARFANRGPRRPAIAPRQQPRLGLVRGTEVRPGRPGPAAARPELVIPLDDDQVLESF